MLRNVSGELELFDFEGKLIIGHANQLANINIALAGIIF